MTASGRIAVLGGGLMGVGIAQTFATAGYETILQEPDAETRRTVGDRLLQGLQQLGDDTAAAELVTVVPDLPNAVSGADYVFEAAPERLPLKRAIFGELVRFAPLHAILASNSSVMPIGSIAGDLDTADRIVGTHWWNPPTLIPLVEVIQGAATSDQTVDRMMTLLSAVGKQPAHIRKDIPGFVANRLQHALWREAIAMVADGICDPKTIDTCVKSSFGMRLSVLGPLENADLVGLDLTRDIHATIIPELNRDTGPNPLLDKLINTGRIGFKTGEGLRSWSETEITQVRERLIKHLLESRKAGKAL